MSNTIIQSSLSTELKNHIFEVFGEHAISATGINGLAEEAISFELHEGSEFTGCVVVQMFWRQLHIRYLIVEAKFRGKNYGKSLMHHAFAYGKQAGCNFAFVETMSFQAPEFYQKLGFKIDFIREGFDKDTKFDYLTKDLR